MPTTASLPIDPATAKAARQLRELLFVASGMDLCAGVTLEVTTVERMAAAVEVLHDRLNLLVASAHVNARSGVYDFTFDVVDAKGRVISAISIRAGGNESPGRLRAVAANRLLENPDLYADGVLLSRDQPRVTLPSLVGG